MSYHAINAATPLPSKIRAVQFFDRTGKQCDLLFGVHIYERATTACKNRPVRCGRSGRWILPSGEQTTATSFPGSVSYPALSLSRYVGAGRREPWGRGYRPLPISANPGFNYN